MKDPSLVQFLEELGYDDVEVMGRTIAEIIGEQNGYVLERGIDHVSI